MLAIPIENVSTEPQQWGEKPCFEGYRIGVARSVLAHFLDDHPMIPSGREIAAPVVAQTVDLSARSRIESRTFGLDPMGSQRNDSECPQPYEIPSAVGPDGRKRTGVDRFEDEQWRCEVVQQSRIECVHPGTLGRTIQIHRGPEARVFAAPRASIALTARSARRIRRSGQ
ncbi:hypothetical protein BRC86_12350 [Halobacteriales archaeon QS_3_64_16]|nr:MAG: hypothetical protein BRC86_12350 [Halobacteriales archaeon QS_3_64_16]